jgi:hypothetical protein
MSGKSPRQPGDHGGLPTVIRGTSEDLGNYEAVLLEVPHSLDVYAGLGYELRQRQLVVGGSSYLAQATGPR